MVKIGNTDKGVCVFVCLCVYVFVVFVVCVEL